MTMITKSVRQYVFFLLVLLGLSNSAGAADLTALAQSVQGYEPGNGALQVWNEDGQAAAPAWVRGWLSFLAIAFISGLLFVWKHPIARWVVLGMVANLLIGRGLIPALGIVKLSGLIGVVHVICWSPALYFLLKERPFTKGLSPFAIWSGIITFVILFSFIFDIRDAVIYLDHILGIGLLS